MTSGNHPESSSSANDNPSFSATSNEEPPDLWPFQMTGDPNDIFVPNGKAAKEISALIGKFVPDRGERSFGGVAYAVPILPGLTVKDIGTVSLPLREEMAEKLAAKGLQAGLETWTLSPHRVEIKNPEWTVGIQTLCTVSAERLGYKDVALQPTLSRVVMCGPGGHVEKHKEQTVEQCVATLEVLLPSEFTGGALVVSDQNEKNNHRYEFDRVKSTVAFRPHYVVHAAGTFSTVEEITSGYRIVLQYSLFLSSQLTLDNTRACSQEMQREFAVAFGRFIDDYEEEETKMKRDNDMDISALMLSKSSTKELIEVDGWKALRGVDRDRCVLLNDTNALLSPERQMKFYFAHLRVYLSAGQEKTTEVSWYSINGGIMSSGDFTTSTRKFNFMNPDSNTLGQMWGDGEPNKNWEHECWVVAMWPASVDIANILSLMGFAAAVPTILTQDLIGISTLRTMLQDDVLGYYHYIRNPHGSKQKSQLLPLCKKLIAAIADSGEVELAGAFFKKYFHQLQEQEKTECITGLSLLVRELGWGSIGIAVLQSINCLSAETSMNRALIMTESLSDNLAARTDLTVFAVNKAQLLVRSNPGRFVSLSTTVLLWKHAHAFGNQRPAVVEDVRNLFRQLDGKFLGSVVEAISKYMIGSRSQQEVVTFGAIVVKRRQWLIDQIFEAKTPFSWQLLDSTCPHVVDVVAFLQEPRASFELHDVKTSSEAHHLVSRLQKCIRAQITITVERRGPQTFVKMLKTGGEFDVRRNEVPAYVAEINRLSLLFPNFKPSNTPCATSKTGMKRARIE